MPANELVELLCPNCGAALGKPEPIAPARQKRRQPPPRLARGGGGPAVVRDHPVKNENVGTVKWRCKTIVLRALRTRFPKARC